ncbi:MAG TPA: hypothetical protein VF522_17700 [Ramlibacter sp.]|uniref:hypothetical protein n=1 Tax=Ramlibacter sp. TaxID=1917967 RepID=UPI002ED3F6D5
MKERIASHVTSAHNVAMLAALLGIGLTGSVATTSAPLSDTLAQRVQAGRLAAEPAGVLAVAKLPQIAFATAARSVPLSFKINHYEKLRDDMKWLPVRYAGETLKTPDPSSRLMLVRAAADYADLDEVGLSYRDVYGIINAETSWIPRMGASKNGTPNLGIAQFEPATARAVGLTDPADPVQAVHAAAIHLRDAALWSAKRIAALKLSPEERATKLREGVSIYYNLSVKGRNKWNGKNTASLPIETRRHIANARLGAQKAAELETQLAELKGRLSHPGVMTVSAR